MGDDRRGATPGNLSAPVAPSPTSKENSALFEDGILYVARYNSDGTANGFRWS